MNAVACFVLTLCAAPDDAAPLAPKSAKEAYQRIVEADHWRPQYEALKGLQSFGANALPFLTEGARHADEDVQEVCYRGLFDSFPDSPETAKAVVVGLSDDTQKIRYTCAFFAGEQKIKAAEPILREIYDGRKYDLQLTAAKSLAQLGNADVIRTLYWSAGSDSAMERIQANAGLKALSSKDLSNFNGYQPLEGTPIISGHELRSELLPIEDAEKKGKRFAALAAYCRWLKTEKPNLWAELDPRLQREIQQRQREIEAIKANRSADPL